MHISKLYATVTSYLSKKWDSADQC